MRLERLLLSRYGLFTDHPIDFGAPSPGNPDLHVIYGENEAGKSTALAAFLDLLFGIPNQSPYNFRHTYATMRIEADIRIGDGADRYIRVKKQKASLQDRHGPVREGVLTSALGGMTRESYKAMFSLDDDTLEAGGDEILKSDGDLGELLFAGAAGLKGLSGTLKGLRENADEFHRDRAKKTQLNELKKRLKDIDKQKKLLDMAAPAYAARVKTRAAAQESYDDAAAAVAKLETARADAGRRLAALPWLAEIRRLREELAGLAALPEPPQAWFDRIGPLLRDEPRLAAKMENFEKQKRDLEEEHRSLTEDEAILALEDRVSQLDALGARYPGEREDLPRRRDTLANIDGNIAAILRRLEKDPGADPAALVVPAAASGALRDLIERRAGVEERRKGAAAVLQDTKAEAERAEKACAEDRAVPDAGRNAAFARLNAVLDDAQGADWRARLNIHTARRRARAEELDDEIGQLRPWSGGAEDLARVEAPEPEELEAWKTALAAAEKNIESLEAEETRLANENAALSARAGAAKAETGVADDDEAAALRAARDEAWARHRAALDAETADVFADRMNAHDAAADNRLAHADALARVRQAGEDLRAAAAKAKRNAEELSRARRRRRKVIDEIAASVAAMIRSGAADMPPDVSLPRLAAWTARRGDILSILKEARSEDAEIARAGADGNRLRARLAEALATVGAASDPADGMEKLTAAVGAAADTEKDRRARAAAALRNLETARANLERRRAEAGRAEDDDNAWRREWDEALSRCWLGEIDPPPSTAEARRLLDDAAELEAARREREPIARQIAGMERNQAAFNAEVKELVERIGENFDATRVLAHYDALKTRLAGEADRRKVRDALKKKIDGVAEELARSANDMAELRAEAGRMFAEFGVDTLPKVEKELRRTERRAELRKKLSEHEARLVEEMGAASSQDAKAALADADRGAIEAKEAKIKVELEDAAARKQERFHKLQQAGDALAAVGGEDDAARLEQERRTTLLEIEEGARDWLRIRLGVAAAKRALDAYLEAHRSSMMKNASEAFRTISRGAYERLESQLTDGGEVLIGVPKGGGAKLAPEMSKGARFQLYLALRVAGYREFVDRHGPVPFIADDILETFDDFRAEETFKVFASMAEYGQVVYLSHHRHLCDIAREVCPSVRIHELPGPSAT